MITTNKNISIGQIKEIILINGDFINFSSHIKLTSQQPFYMSIVTEETLETSPELQYNYITEKETELEIRNDNNIFTRFFIVLKSDNPQDIVFTCNLQETPLQESQPCDKKRTYLEGFDGPTSGTAATGGTTSGGTEWYYDWKYWTIIILIIALVIYWFYFRKKENNRDETNLMSAQSSVI